MAVRLSDARPDTAAMRAYREVAAGAAPMRELQERHEERMRETYRALVLIREAVDRGLVQPGSRFEVDRPKAGERSSTPGRLMIVDPNGRRKSFEETLGLDGDRGRRPIGERDRMLDVVEGWAHAAGMRGSFAAAANAVATKEASPNRAMEAIVQPGFAEALRRANGKIDRNMALVEGLNGVQVANASPIELAARLRAHQALEAALDPKLAREMSIEDRMDARLDALREMDKDAKPDPEATPAGRALVDAHEALDAITERLSEEMKELERLAEKAQIAATAAADPSRSDEARMEAMNDANEYSERLGQAWSKIQYEVAPQLEQELDLKLSPVAPDVASSFKAEFRAAYVQPPQFLQDTTRDLEDAREKFDRDMRLRQEADERVKQDPRLERSYSPSRAPEFRPGM